MFEGENRVVFSKETANKLLSRFMSSLFNSPITVTGIEKDYKGLAIDFTEDIAEGKAAKSEKTPVETNEV